MADNCRVYDGSDDYLKDIDPTGPVLDAAWTVGGWFYADDVATRVLWKAGADDDANFKVSMYYLFGDLRLRIGGGTVDGNENIATGAWRRIGATRAGSGGSVTCKIILDGSETASGTLGEPTVLASGDVVSVGRGLSGIGVSNFDGKSAWFFWLQGVVLSAAALDGYLNDPESLIDDYGPSGGVTANALKIFWPQQCDTVAETDESGVGNDGTYNGAVWEEGTGPSPSTPWDPCAAEPVVTQHGALHRVLVQPIAVQ